MSDDPRESLARAQADLVRALTAQTEAPADFDPAQVALAARMLQQKRAHGVARAWPRLAASLGDRFADHFAEYSIAHPIRGSTDRTADGLRFVQFLRQRRQLPDDGCIEWLEYRAARRWIAVARLSTPAKRLVVCLRIPWRRRIYLIQI